MNASIEHIQRLARKFGNVFFPNMSVATLLAAIEIQKDLPIHRYTYDYEFSPLWANEVLPLVEAHAARMARVLMIDKEHLIEASRRIYQKRGRVWQDPSHILFNEIEYWDITHRFDDMPEGDSTAAFMAVCDIIRKHVEIFAGLTVPGDGISASKKTVIDEVFDIMEGDNPNIPARRHNNMKEMVRLIIERIVTFMYQVRSGAMIGDRLATDYFGACLDALNFTGENRTVALNLLTGVKSDVGSHDVIKALLDGYKLKNMYTGEAEVVHE